MTKRLIKIPILLLAVLLFAAPTSFARDRAWYKYENEFFEAYSDASEKRVMGMLEELENFRAAIIQVMNLQMPDGAAKTQVVIFNATRDFKELVYRDGVAAYVLGVRGVPHIVMYRGGDARSREAIVRHEFAHVLLRYNPFAYPWWFDEGFAEFVSSVDFRKKNTQFRLGAPPLRAGTYRGPKMEWPELIAHTGFDDDADLQTASNAYLQSWILVHHILLGHEFKHVPELADYFYYTANGEPPHIAFGKAFDVTPEEMGEPLLESKSTRIDVYTFEFNDRFRDIDFVKSEISREDVESIIAGIRSAQPQPED